MFQICTTYVLTLISMYFIFLLKCFKKLTCLSFFSDVPLNASQEIQPIGTVEIIRSKNDDRF